MGHALFEGCLKNFGATSSRTISVRIWPPKEFLSSQPLDAGLDRFGVDSVFRHGLDAGLDLVLVLPPDVFHYVAVDLADV